MIYVHDAFYNLSYYARQMYSPLFIGRVFQFSVKVVSSALRPSSGLESEDDGSDGVAAIILTLKREQAPLTPS